MPDLTVPPGPGIPDGLVIPAEALSERFARASGPGGQGVNTTDSRVQLSLDLDAAGLEPALRARVNRALARQLTSGRITVDASEHRSQRMNRRAARERLADLLRDALAPPPAPRRRTRPSRGAVERRLRDKRRRGEVKATRADPPRDS